MDKYSTMTNMQCRKHFGASYCQMPNQYLCIFDIACQFLVTWQQPKVRYCAPLPYIQVERLSTCLVTWWHEKEYVLLELERAVLSLLSSYRRCLVRIIAYTYMQTNFCMKQPPMWQQVNSGLIQSLPYLATEENLLLLTGKRLYEIWLVIMCTVYIWIYVHTCTLPLHTDPVYHPSFRAQTAPRDILRHKSKSANYQQTMIKYPQNTTLPCLTKVKHHRGWLYSSGTHVPPTQVYHVLGPRVLHHSSA